MTILEIEKEIQSREINVNGQAGMLVSGATYLYNYEVWDRKAGFLLYLMDQTIMVHDRARERMEVGSKPTSGYRTRSTQDALSTKWGKASFSPHTMGAAIDLDTDTVSEAESWRDAIYLACKDLGFPKARIGIRKYKGNFIHFDMVFFHFKEFGGQFEYPDPNEETDSDSRVSAEKIKLAWRPGISW